MERRRLVSILGLIILLVGLLAACSEQDEGKSGPPEGNDDEQKKVFDPASDPDAAQLTEYDDDRMQAQKDADKRLAEDLASGDYSLEDPYVKLDPYDAAPLSALLQFETDKPMQIEVITGTGDGEVPITKTWSAYKTEHEIPVLGLYPDETNQVLIKAYDKDGNKKSTEVSIKTDPLPDDMPQTDLKTSNPEQMADGLTFITTAKNYLYAVDEDANVRWYSSLDTRLILSRLSNGHFLINVRGNDEDQYKDMLEIDPLGKRYNAYRISIDNYDDDNLIHHDVIDLPSGNLLATVHDPDSKYVEDTMIEIDRNTGKTVQQIDLKDIFPEKVYEDYDGEYADDNDWFHQNAVWFDEADNSILVSSRHQDAVMNLSYPDADVQWILGADEGWSDNLEDKLLEPVDDDVKFPTAQHAVKKLPDMDDDPDTEDIILFDNNHVVTRGDETISDDYSRMVQYRINEKEQTVDEIWSYGEGRGEDFYSSIVGNVQYMPDTGNRLITSGYIAPNPDGDARESRIVETNDKDDADVLYEIKLSGFNEDSHKFAYRAHRWPLYTAPGT
ncbi:aryl-sulfate sulfotransferase [Barrientosiimonas marina]|uniref:Aryl-sulfate sulfotransferase n=1 Tax=Lentibacillus kimchii TaxID=1542911 RepID=A0ABW2UX23_9BACI